MIRSTIKRVLKRVLRRGPSDRLPPSPASERPAPTPDAAPQKGERDGDTPWYLDGSTETWGWENTNAREDEAE